VREKVILRLLSKSPYECSDCRHRYARLRHRSRDSKKNRRQISSTRILVLGLIIATLTTLALVEWADRPTRTPVAEQ
jgi:hypothetical protein